MKTKIVILCSLLCAVLLAPGPAHASIGVNDYPGNLANAARDAVVDPWAFYNRECTSFVAWRINNDDHAAFSNNMTGLNHVAGHFGDASNWAANAAAIGYAVNTSPAAGAIAVWPSSVGHVAYVDGVNSGGTINTEEYNWSGDGAYHTRANFNWSAAGVRFIHIKDLSSGGSGGGVQGMTYLGTNQLAHGRRMYPNQYILSADARYVLTLQGDGNVVMYGPGYTPLWSTGTGGRSVDSLLVQDDGNVVLYGTGSQGAIWSTGTVGVGNASFQVQDDGNVVLYDGGGVAHWSTGARGHVTGGTYAGSDVRNADQWLRPNQYLKSSDGRYALYQQEDGNLVLWSPGGRVQWTSGSAGHSGVEGLLQQSDGNLVIYAHGAIWSSNVTGSGAFQLKVQNDGNVVVYNTGNGIALWATGTAGRI
jgi:surface antigen